MRALLLLTTLSLLASCSSGPEPSTPRHLAESVRAPEAPAPEPVPPLPPATYPAPARLVAVGDIHGDVNALRSVLRLAGAIDETNHWVGGELVIVQTGDVLDRGDDEPEILDLIAQLEVEAAAAGGRFIALNGNHEIMNAQRDFRYVTPEGFTDFASFRREASREARAELPTDQEGRAGAFEPGRRHARAFAARNTVVIVGNTVFVHGGLAPRYAQVGMERINQAARDFYLGEGPLSPLLQAQDSPIWNRTYAIGENAEMCTELDESLAVMHAERMVIGHTVHDEGIGSACNGHVWRIDVGLGENYGGPIEALEIIGNDVRVLHGER